MSPEAPQTTRQVVETVLLDPQERRKLLSFAGSRYGIAVQDAEDILQETALDLLRQRHYVHSPQGYLFTVFVRRCIRFLRSRRREGDVRELPENLPDLNSGALDRERADQRFAIREALHRISSSCRKLLAARYVEGQKLWETARAMALARSGVGVTINRCLKRLRACLG